MNWNELLDRTIALFEGDPVPPARPPKHETIMTTMRQPTQPSDTAYMGGKMYRHYTEVTPDGVLADVHDLDLSERSDAMDEYDEQAMQAHNGQPTRYKIRPELYVILKQLWAKGLTAKAAGSTPAVRAEKGCGTRIRAEYWKVMNAAEAARQSRGVTPSPTQKTTLRAMRVQKRVQHT